MLAERSSHIAISKGPYRAGHRIRAAHVQPERRVLIGHQPGVPGHPQHPPVASEQIGLHLATGAASDLVGTVRIRVTPVSGPGPAFIGIAPAGAAARYLAGVDYAIVRGAAGDHGTYTEHPGSAPAVPPRQAGIWAVQAAGPGTQTLTWAVRSGDWLVVAGVLIGGIIFLAGGILLIAVPLRLASRQ